MMVLLTWIVASLLLLVALVLRGWLDGLQARLKERQRRRIEVERQVLRKSGWR